MILLKLGGSLITDKQRPETPRPQVISRLAREIAQAKRKLPELKLVVGHGSGSFGHSVAARHSTHLGASSAADWVGFAEVWASAQRLNRLVIDGLIEVGFPAIAFPPSASATSDDGIMVEMAIEPLKKALENGLLPVVHGDVAFDLTRGATILSTEKVFAYLAEHLRPERVLLAGLDPGVYADYPQSDEILPVVTEYDLLQINLEGAATPDVTGGMVNKVQEAMALARTLPDLEVRIFSGEEPGTLTSALLGGTPGTLIAIDKE